MKAVILRSGQHQMRQGQPGMTQQSAPEFRRIIGEKDRHAAIGAAGTHLNADLAHDFFIVMRSINDPHILFVLSNNLMA